MVENSSHSYKVLLNGKVIRENSYIDAESVELLGGIELYGEIVVVVAGYFRVFWWVDADNSYSNIHNYKGLIAVIIFFS